MSGGDERYAYYFDSQRPAFVERLLERKHAVLWRRVRRRLPTHRFLEVGPGEGRMAALATRSGASYLAVEASPAGVRQLRADGFEVLEAIVPPLPDGIGAVDCIFASHVIEHLAGPDEVRAFLVAAREHLTPGGGVALVFPDARFMGFDFWESDYTHRWPSTERRVRQVAVDAGLEVVDCTRVCVSATGRAARALATVAKLYPYGLLATLAPSRKEFWYRGRLLFSLDVVMILQTPPPNADARAT
jgi:SAM-dependent methyltransferase